MINRGVIVKSLSGFYYVSYDNKRYECVLRGKLKSKSFRPLVGDFAEFEIIDSEHGVITSIKERKNQMIRPAVCNIDCLVFIASETIPVTDPFLIDRVSVMAENNGCEFVLCVNKSDLSNSSRLYGIYSRLYKVFVTSSVSGAGIDDLREYLRGKVCAFTGNSGVGKSSILNYICPDFKIQTDDISLKLGRGKHTTRHVELYDIGNNTFIADTPGFASFDNEAMLGISKEKLPGLFKEFRLFTDECAFSDCFHISEPGCKVIEAVQNGIIENSRYNSYKRLREEIRKNENYNH